LAKAEGLRYKTAQGSPEGLRYHCATKSNGIRLRTRWGTF